jgi:hypothetical protein
VAGGCGDVNCVGVAEESGIDGGDVPAGHFLYVVAAFTGPAAVLQDGGPAVAVADDVIKMSDRRSRGLCRFGPGAG